MKKFLLIGVALLSTAALAQDTATTIPQEYTFMVVGVHNNATGAREHEKFFEGPVPKIGEAVEMVYVGNTGDGDMRFQLRTKR